MAPDARAPNDSPEGHTFHYAAEEDNQPAAVIVTAVSQIKGRPVLELEPLHDTLDTDGLNDLFSKQKTQPDFYRSSSQSMFPSPVLTFEYEGCLITVTSGRIRIEPD